MTAPVNLFTDVPANLSREVVDTLRNAPGVRIERIVSRGHTSPDGFWYDQEWHEWVLLLSGAARLRLEGAEPIELVPGSFVDIPARRRHRVDWTDPDQVTIWLAVHYWE